MKSVRVVERDLSDSGDIMEFKDDSDDESETKQEESKSSKQAKGNILFEKDKKQVAAAKNKVTNRLKSAVALSDSDDFSDFKRLNISVISFLFAIFLIVFFCSSRLSDPEDDVFDTPKKVNKNKLTVSDLDALGAKKASVLEDFGNEESKSPSKFQNALDSIKRGHDTALDELEAKNKDEINALKKSHIAKMDSLREKYKSEVNYVFTSIKNILNSNYSLIQLLML